MLIYEIFIVKLFIKHEILGACLMTTQALQYCCLWMLWELKTLASIFAANAVGVPWFSGHSASHCLNTKGQLFVHGLTQTTVLHNQWTSGPLYKRIDLINKLLNPWEKLAFNFFSHSSSSSSWSGQACLVSHDTLPQPSPPSPPSR